MHFLENKRLKRSVTEAELILQPLSVASQRFRKTGSDGSYLAARELVAGLASAGRIWQGLSPAEHGKKERLFADIFADRG